jgi:hypothetical protein
LTAIALACACRVPARVQPTPGARVWNVPLPKQAGIEMPGAEDAEADEDEAGTAADSSEDAAAGAAAAATTGAAAAGAQGSGSATAAAAAAGQRPRRATTTPAWQQEATNLLQKDQESDSDSDVEITDSQLQGSSDWCTVRGVCVEGCVPMAHGAQIERCVLRAWWWWRVGAQHACRL